MSNIKQIIQLLDNPSYIYEYITYLIGCNKGVQTRHQKILNTVACRLWQLQYCILTIICRRNIKLINPRDLNHLCKIYFNIFTNQRSLLFDFIAQNNLSLLPSSLCYRDYPDKFQKYISSNENIYLCIYGIHKGNNQIYRNGIVHYFTIIRDESDYYITSSYGSDNIRVPYSKVKLDTIKSFYDFCEILKETNKTSEQNEYISYFMRRFFLNNAVPIRYYFEDKDVTEYKKLYPQWIPPGIGETKEINYILNNTEMNFDIAIITNYEALVNYELFHSSYASAFSASSSLSSVSSRKRKAGIIDTLVKYKKTKTKKSKRKKYKPGK